MKIRRITQILSLLVVAGLCAQTSLAQGMMRAPGSGSSPGTSGPRAGEGVANPGAKTTGQSGGSGMMRAPGSGSSSGTSGPRAGEGAANLRGTSRTFHTPGGTITPGTEGTGQKPRGQDITLPGEKKGSAEPTKGTSKGPSTFTTPGGKITPGTEGTGQKPRGETIRPASDEKVGAKVGMPSKGILIGAPPTVIQKGEPGAAQITPGLAPRAISIPAAGVPTGVSAPTGTSAPATGVSAPSIPVIEVPKVPSIDVQ